MLEKPDADGRIGATGVSVGADEEERVGGAVRVGVARVLVRRGEAVREVGLRRGDRFPAPLPRADVLRVLGGVGERVVLGRVHAVYGELNRACTRDMAQRRALIRIHLIPVV